MTRKYTQGKTKRKIQIEKIQFVKHKIKKHKSETQINRHTSGNTHRKTQTKQYKSENTNQTNINRKIQYGKYKSEDTNQKIQLGKCSWNIQFGK